MQTEEIVFQVGFDFIQWSILRADSCDILLSTATDHGRQCLLHVVASENRWASYSSSNNCFRSPKQYRNRLATWPLHFENIHLYLIHPPIKIAAIRSSRLRGRGRQQVQSWGLYHV